MNQPSFARSTQFFSLVGTLACLACSAGGETELDGSGGTAGSTGGASIGTGGEAMGTGSAAGTGGVNAGSGGSDPGGTGGDTSTGGTGTGGETAGAAPCPADATFCADFETANLPAGAIYNRNGAPGEFTLDFEIDNSVFYAGGGSLRVRPTSEEPGSAYKMLAVPAPGSQFWMRVYMRADAPLGNGTVSSSEHNAFVIAASGSETNTTDALEFAEDCGIAFNQHDTVKRPASTGGNCETPLSLPANQWYCIEASFNGTTGDSQLYIDNVLQIDAPAWEGGKGAFTHLKFGVNNLHPNAARQVWYDDIAVGPTRPGCK